MNWTRRRKRRILRQRGMRALLVLCGSVALLCSAGMFLPREQVLSGQALLDRPPETVWRILTDLDGMPLWRSDLTEVERLPDLGGRPAWRESGRDGQRVVLLATAEPGRLIFRRALEGLPALPMRTFELVAAARGTRVTLTERAETGNPLRRVLNRIYPPRRGIVRFLHDLDQRLSGGRRQVAAVPQ